MIRDVLVIGAGGAGLSLALSLKNRGADVLVVSESYPTRSQTSMAQGGINAVLPHTDGKIEDHIDDTYRASYGLGDRSMIEMMCREAPKAIDWLNSIGVPFSINDDGLIAQRRLGGTKVARACYSQDYSGLKIIQTLYDNSLYHDVNYLYEHYLLEIVVEDGSVKGAIFLDIRTTKIVLIKAKSVVLATGGYSGIYYNHTTNMHSQNGDGLVVASRAGAKLSGLEFVQFHPTALKSSSVLISESARGAGGILLNQNGDRFVDELESRDVVSRAIYKEMQNGNQVFLDIRSLGEEFIDDKLPQERKLSILHEGVDPVKELVPIKPAAHYSMGGVEVDNKFMSNIDGLFCIGECSNARVHGANRLGGNSLLEIVTFGRLSANSIYEYIQNIDEVEVVDTRINKASQNIEAIFDKQGDGNFYDFQKELGDKLYECAGIIRDIEGLKSLVRYCEDTLTRDIALSDGSRIYNTTLVDFLKFKNSLVLAKLIAESALSRQESLGSHWYED
jgi:succinate dehydrogenase / fumarate reductase flavoprotein subunit